MFEFQEYFTIQRDEWKAVKISLAPDEGPLVWVFRNGLKQRQNVDFFRNAVDRTFFFFPFVEKGDLIEIVFKRSE